MHPELFTLPGGFSVKTYGFFMMIGFLTGVWMAMRRAARVKADPDIVLDISLLCLLFGIGGARIFYVIHYWKSQFADHPNPLFAIIDIRAGGLEFLGGFLGAVLATIVHAWWKKYSIRLYLDIMAPSAMWGLALGRIGCYFNGCCFGALAATAVAGSATAETDNAANAIRVVSAREQTVSLVSQNVPPPLPVGADAPQEEAAGGRGQVDNRQSPIANPPKPALPWAVQFPYGSPAHVRHWENRLVTVPAELISMPRDGLLPMLVPEYQLFMPVEKRQAILRKIQDLEAAYKAVADADSAEARTLRREWDDARKDAVYQLGALLEAQKFPSRAQPQRESSVSELEALAHQCRSLPVHPAQLYATLGALILSGLLALVFYRRKRHGVVIGLTLLLYPVQRTLEEIIRADNPQDVAGLTVSQSISLGLILAGAAYLYVLYTKLPERSPLAVCAAPKP
jgi:prolipoprotein diacylglyceryltransferase